MSNEKVMNRWLVVIGAILIQLALGAIYAWSVFTPTLIDAGWTIVNTQVVFSVGLAFFAIVMVLAGKKLNSWGPRNLAISGGLILGLGYLLAGLFGGTDFILLVIFIGVLGGSGIGLAYVVPIAVGMRWFPDKKGMITGLAVAGFGFGAMGWVKLAGAWGHLIQNIGLSTTFTVYGIIFAIMVILGGLTMIFPPEGWKPEGFVEENSGAATSNSNFESSQMLKTAQFYMIWLVFFFGASAGLMSIGLMKLYPMEALVKTGFSGTEAKAIAGTAMAVFFSLANGLGRIGWGTISDKLGRKASIFIMSASQGIVVICFTFMAGTPALLYLGATLIGFNFGGNFALFPAITADTFGTKNVGNNYPFIFLSYGVGGIAGPIMGGVLGGLGNFSLAFTICGVACLAGALIIALVKPPQLSVIEAKEKNLMNEAN